MTLDEYGNPLVVRTNPAGEGNVHAGPYHVSGGWLPAGVPLNFWQCDIDPVPTTCGAFVEACVDAYARTIAMLPASHWRRLDNGGRERVETSALSRIIMNPNDYQSSTDFILNLVRQLFLTGNAYALADRNDRFEVSELHLFDPKTSTHRISDDGAIFYELAGNLVKEARLRSETDGLRARGLAPARDVLHLKLDAKPSDPLNGIPPWRYAELAVIAQNALASQMTAFFGNQSRPAGVLSTDAVITEQQLTELRERWNAQARGLNAGGTPILTNGMKYQPISMSAKDAEVPAILQQLGQQICLVYGIPPSVLGIGATTYASVEILMQGWLAQGLGFALSVVEDAIGKFFGLRGYPIDYLSFDTSMLLRSAFKDRIEGLARGVQGGIYAPNEARREEGYPDAKDGDEPRVQQQVVPLSAWSAKPPKTPAPEAPPAPEPASPADTTPPTDTTESLIDVLTAHVAAEQAVLRRAA